MRTKDTVLLGEAYSKVKVLEESKFRDIAAALALGAAGAHGSQMVPDDLADKHGLNPPIVQKVEAPKQEEPSNYYKAKTAYDKAVKGNKPDTQALKDIASDEDYAKRYAMHLILTGQRVPDIVKNVIPQYTKSFQDAAKSDVLN
jgi:hypothetical protein